jgi:lysophospholipase L1-like esterase
MKLIPLLLTTTIILSASLTRAQDPSPIDPGKFDGTIRVTCVGDSITQGVGAKRGQSWPAQLQEMLGDKWSVKNVGRSGTTLMNSGDSPYQKCPQFKTAMKTPADVVIIMLGTNDTKPANWAHFEKDYEKDYRDLISKFVSLPSKPRIFLCLPPYIAKDGNWGINEPDTVAQIPIIKKIAKDLKLGLIDVHGALLGMDELIPDKVHPNTDGATVIAKAIHLGLTGKNATN